VGGSPPPGRLGEQAESQPVPGWPPHTGRSHQCLQSIGVFYPGRQGLSPSTSTCFLGSGRPCLKARVLKGQRSGAQQEPVRQGGEGWGGRQQWRRALLGSQEEEGAALGVQQVSLCAIQQTGPGCSPSVAQPHGTTQAPSCHGMVGKGPSPAMRVPSLQPAHLGGEVTGRLPKA
jgi:hypothetical protein